MTTVKLKSRSTGPLGSRLDGVSEASRREILDRIDRMGTLASFRLVYRSDGTSQLLYVVRQADYTRRIYASDGDVYTCDYHAWRETYRPRTQDVTPSLPRHFRRAVLEAWAARDEEAVLDLLTSHQAEIRTAEESARVAEVAA
jgi:hypothetical protein